MFRIECWNEDWKSWSPFNTELYATEVDAQKVIDSYLKDIPNVKSRILDTGTPELSTIQAPLSTVV